MRLVLIIGLIVQCALLQASTLIDGLYYDLDTSNRTATVTYEVDGTGNYASLSANVKIPENVVYNGVTFTVTKIADKAFANCTVMESISIPATVVQVGDYRKESSTDPSTLPFYECSSLKEVRFEDGKEPIYLGSYCRYYLYFDALNYLLNREVKCSSFDIDIQKIAEKNDTHDIIKKMEIIDKFIFDLKYNVNINLFLDNFIISMGSV